LGFEGLPVVGDSLAQAIFEWGKYDGHPATNHGSDRYRRLVGKGAPLKMKNWSGERDQRAKVTNARTPDARTGRVR
jgi:hypothetical protein